MDKKIERKKDCEKIERLIQNEMDNVITDRDHQLLNTHLETCQACAGEKEELLKLHSIFQDNFVNIEIPELSNKFNREFYRKLDEITRLTLWGRVREKLSVPTSTLVELRVAAVTVIAIMIAVVGIRQYDSIILNRMKLLETDTLKEINTNSALIYNAAAEKTANKELKRTANKQAREIISIAGIRG